MKGGRGVPKQYTEALKVSADLKNLVEQWKREVKFRDMGVTARATWKRIKGLASLEEQVKILEEQFIGE